MHSGDLPISATMLDGYLRGLEAIHAIFRERSGHEDQIDAVSFVKGMFKRVAKRDQSDWQLVSSLLDDPNEYLARDCARWCTELRNRLKDGQVLDHHLRSNVAQEVRRRCETALRSLRLHPD